MNGDRSGLRAIAAPPLTGRRFRFCGFGPARVRSCPENHPLGDCDPLSLGTGQGLQHRPDALPAVGAFHELFEAGDGTHFPAKRREALVSDGLQMVGGEEGLRR